ncbi:hypothetical protein, partial [uncultured Fibrobacter sp.]|uniref:hypothetical protein n=1 Tax=uncultured Fibrobacter sp. TaxID=261512 RepID=UPI0026190904
MQRGQRIYIETSKRKPEQIVLIFAQHLCMSGSREEGRKVLPFDAHAVTDFIESHGNETANIIKTDSYVIESDWKETYEMTVEVEKCNYKLFSYFLIATNLERATAPTIQTISQTPKSIRNYEQEEQNRHLLRRHDRRRTEESGNARTD